MAYTLIEHIRRILGVTDDVLDEELPIIIQQIIDAQADLATAQAAELARKDAALDRIIAAAKDGIRVVQEPPPKPDIITGD